MISHIARKRQRGVAAVELALILMGTAFLLPAIFLFARVFYHYSVIKQATQDAANTMAATPRMEMMTSAGMNATKARSMLLVTNAIAAAGIAPPANLVVDIDCNGIPCVAATPVLEVRVFASFTLFDEFYRATFPWLPDAMGPSWTFSAASDAPYQN